MRAKREEEIGGKERVVPVGKGGGEGGDGSGGGERLIPHHFLGVEGKQMQMQMQLETVKCNQDSMIQARVQRESSSSRKEEPTLPKRGWNWLCCVSKKRERHMNWVPIFMLLL